MVSAPIVTPLFIGVLDSLGFPSKSCILCPTEGGAFKQTVTNEWVHLLCAIWVPETGVANEVFMEPVTGVEKISKQRWRLVRIIHTDIPVSTRRVVTCLIEMSNL